MAVDSLNGRVQRNLMNPMTMPITASTQASVEVHTMMSYQSGCCTRSGVK